MTTQEQLVPIIKTLNDVYRDLERVLSPQPIHQKRTYQLEEALRNVAATLAILVGVAANTEDLLRQALQRGTDQ